MGFFGLFKKSPPSGHVEQSTVTSTQDIPINDEKLKLDEKLKPILNGAEEKYETHWMKYDSSINPKTSITKHPYNNINVGQMYALLRKGLPASIAYVYEKTEGNCKINGQKNEEKCYLVKVKYLKRTYLDKDSSEIKQRPILEDIVYYSRENKANDSDIKGNLYELIEKKEYKVVPKNPDVTEEDTENKVVPEEDTEEQEVQYDQGNKVVQDDKAVGGKRTRRNKKLTAKRRKPHKKTAKRRKHHKK